MPDGGYEIDPMHYGAGGPVECAHRFLIAVCEEGSHDAAWSMMDDNLRLCRAQAWLWPNREHPTIAGRHEQLAERFVTEAMTRDQVWDAFADYELGAMVDAWGEAYGRDLGAASHPRPISPDLEVVLFVPTDGQILTFDQPTLVQDALPFVVRLVQSTWKVAGFGDFVPTPGWPPQLQRPFNAS